MEYTIRCDVESINVDELPQDFKTNTKATVFTTKLSATPLAGHWHN
jgi:hypothetical protein